MLSEKYQLCQPGGRFTFGSHLEPVVGRKLVCHTQMLFLPNVSDQTSGGMRTWLVAWAVHIS